MPKNLLARRVRPRHPRGATDWTPLDVVGAAGFVELPIDPHAVAAQFDIEVEGGALSGVAGCLMCVGNDLKIVYSNRTSNIGFQHFTVAHELGHFFHPGHLEELFAGGATMHQSRGAFVSKKRVERQADNYAVDLLMPEDLFRPALASVGGGLGAVIELAALCNTSLTATAIRFASLACDPVLVVVSDGRKIEYAVISPGLPGFDAFALRGSPVPEGSLTRSYSAFPEKIRQRSQEEADTRLGTWLPTDSADWYAEECFGLGRYGRVLTVLTPD